METVSFLPPKQLTEVRAGAAEYKVGAIVGGGERQLLAAGADEDKVGMIQVRWEVRRQLVSCCVLCFRNLDETGHVQWTSSAIPPGCGAGAVGCPGPVSLTGAIHMARRAKPGCPGCEHLFEVVGSGTAAPPDCWTKGGRQLWGCVGLLRRLHRLAHSPKVNCGPLSEVRKQPCQTLQSTGGKGHGCRRQWW